MLLFSSAAAQDPGSIQRVATLRGQGGLVASTVAPGSEPGSELLYASFLYYGDTLEVISIDPLTGQVSVFPNPAKGEFGARCMTTGLDGNVYLGTLPTAHLLRLETRTGRLVDLGRPSSTEQYIWDLAFARDGRLYGATYPNAKLVRFDPKSGTMEDLGRMDDSEMYAHYVAIGAGNFVYVGIGTRRMDIVAYDTVSRERRGILPAAARPTGQAIVYTGTDGVAYGIAGSRHYRLDGWTATPIERAPPRPKGTSTSRGWALALGSDSIRATNPSAGMEISTRFAYPGRRLPLFRVGLGPEGRIYGSSILPARLVRLEEAIGTFETLGELGPGEVYSFLSTKAHLLMGAYACASPLFSFDPRRPFAFDSGTANPSKIEYAHSEQMWRPQAFILGPDGRAYAGATAEYGRLEGQLVAWDVGAGTVERIAGLPNDLGVTALAAAEGSIVVGTTVNGGGGTTPSRTSAFLLLWSPGARSVLKSLTPVPGAATIENLVTLPSSRVLGIAGGTLFVVDLAEWRLTSTARLPFSARTVFGALAAGPDGRIWGLAEGPSGGIFVIDPVTLTATLAARPPLPITGGFALRGSELYFTSGADLYRYRIPELLH